MLTSRLSTSPTLWGDKVAFGEKSFIVFN